MYFITQILSYCNVIKFDYMFEWIFRKTMYTRIMYTSVTYPAQSPDFATLDYFYIRPSEQCKPLFQIIKFKK